MLLHIYFNLRLVLCLYTHICTYHQKQDIKKTKRLLFKYVSPFLHENPCFHECEGHLFYKPFLLDTVPNVQILSLPGIREMAQKPGFSRHGWLLVKLLSWELPTWSTSEILDPVLTGGKQQQQKKPICFPWRPVCMTMFSTRSKDDRDKRETHLRQCLKDH